MEFDKFSIIAIGAFAIMAIGLIGAFHNRYRLGKGMGARFVQVLTIILIIPTILILAGYKIIDGATVGALLGTLVGYVLSKIGDFKSSKTNENAKP